MEKNSSLRLLSFVEGQGDVAALPMLLRRLRDLGVELSECMEPRRGASYKETAHQAKLSAVFDLSAAYARCRSFRKMVKAFGECCAGMGHPITKWPPYLCDFAD